VVVVLVEPDVVPVLLELLTVVPLPSLRVVLVAFHGCHTKSAISATTTTTAIKLKVASDPPFSRSTEMLRSSIRAGSSKGSSTQEAACL
jgi:hypothetical protein